MTAPDPALAPEAVSRLRAEVGTSADAPGHVGGGAEQPDVRRGGLVGRAKTVAKMAVRKSLGWYVEQTVQERTGAAVAELEARTGSKDEVRVQTVNLELLKGEVRSLLNTVEELGMAIAPATGIEGASARMAELRERTHAVDRRLRRMEADGPMSPSSSTAGSEPGSAAEPTAQPASSRFDYAGFERRFRGNPEAVATALKDRYLDLLRPHAPVADLGCGRGDLVMALGTEGIEAVGVELDPVAAADGAERGADVQQGDAVEWLRQRPAGSLGAITAIQVVEHLTLDHLLELLELALSRLRPGGLFIAETPNPQSLIVLGNSYVLDPTHVRPLHPSLLAFLCESAGFADVRLGFYEPALDYHLPLLADSDTPEWAQPLNQAITRLNHVLFGPQDYAVIATAPPPPG